MRHSVDPHQLIHYLKMQKLMHLIRVIMAIRMVMQACLMPDIHWALATDIHTMVIRITEAEQGTTIHIQARIMVSYEIPTITHLPTDTFHQKEENIWVINQ